MNSLRILGRALPKPQTFRPLTSRGYSIVSRSSARPTWQAVKKISYPAFSTSIARKEPAGENDPELAAKFVHERELELENTENASFTEQIEAFKAKGVWEIIDRPGTHEITLQRELGNEIIKVECSITCFTDMAEEEDFSMDEEDGALGDEDYQQPKRTINQSGTKGGPIDVMPEDSLAPADRDDGEFAEDVDRTSYPIMLDISISKAGADSIELRAQADDGTISLHTIQYVPATPVDDNNTTPYAGPPFSNLDTGLQAMFDAYLEERGINTELAMILPILIENKEQREYVAWLDDMQKFISL